MDLFSFFGLFGGLALFLYGMHVMSSGLEKLAGGKLEHALRKLTKNRFVALILGAGITIAIQSSSALTVMLVGLVNSGILKFQQTIGVLMGSNIGTTLTAWILSLAGIESSSILLNLLKPKNFSPIAALIGVLLIMGAKQPKKKSIGSILVGFAVLMYGMTFMSDAMAPLADSPKFASILTAFSNPLLAVLVGAVFTGIIQSSAASVGVLQALSMTGSITYNMAIPIIMGQNIGTCVTALISSIGVTRNARKVAVVHLAFNIFGTVLCLVPYLLVNAFVGFSFAEQPIDPFMIAVVHSIFNVVTTFVLLPFTKQLEKLAIRIIPEKEDEKSVLFDARLLTVPAFAVAKAEDAAKDMAVLAEKAVLKAAALLQKFDEAAGAEVEAMESQLDGYEDQIGSYLVQLSKQELSEEETGKVTMLLHTIGDLERIGDHAENLMFVAKEIHEKNVTFSDEAWTELNQLTAAIFEILNITIETFRTGNLQLAAKVEPLEQVIDGLGSTIRSRHITRLRSGNCTIELGFILTDMLVNCERISDHCSNIAVAVIENNRDTFDAHAYLSEVKSGRSAQFEEDFAKYSEQYALK